MFFFQAKFNDFFGLFRIYLYNFVEIEIINTKLNTYA